MTTDIALKLHQLAALSATLDDADQQTLRNASAWMEAGALSTYSNEDFDILQRLVSMHDRLSRRTVFVYGTLKCGGRLAYVWPAAPLTVLPATIRAALYSVGGGSYPCVVDGLDRVGGELWIFAEADIQRVMARLDQVEGEGYMYHRSRVEATIDDNGAVMKAYAYFYAKPLDYCTRIAATNGVAVWNW